MHVRGPAIRGGWHRGFIDDVYANPNGLPMCSGYFELRHTDAALDYYYDYDEMKVVLEGEFRLENPDTGQVQIARAKDAIFFRRAPASCSPPPRTTRWRSTSATGPSPPRDHA